MGEAGSIETIPSAAKGARERVHEREVSSWGGGGKADGLKRGKLGKKRNWGKRVYHVMRSLE